MAAGDSSWRQRTVNGMSSCDARAPPPPARLATVDRSPARPRLAAANGEPGQESAASRRPRGKALFAGSAWPVSACACLNSGLARRE